MTKPITRHERALGWLTGHALTYLAKAAHKRQDKHLFDHLRAAIQMGNTNHPWGCQLHRPPKL